MSSTTALLLDTAGRGELHHALILHGPSRELLLSTAVSVAKAVNCVAAKGNDGCVSCAKIDRGVHPDVHLVAVSEDRKLIAVEQIREVINGASLRPYEGRTKVYIIDAADTMSVSGANALLKTLEEPTRDTTFMLLTRSPDLLLPTIRSRSQAIHIRDELATSATLLAQRERLPLQLARLVASFPMAERSELEALAREAISSVALFAQGNAGGLLRCAAVYAEYDPPSDALAIFASVMRDIAALAPEDSLDPSKVRAVQESVDRNLLLAVADRAVRGVGRLAVNVDLRLVFEQALAQLVRK